jgi:putative hydrolase of the HAD superfamily
VPKPAPDTYDRFIARHNVTPGNAVLFEDTAANLKPAAAMGLTTVLIVPGEDGVANDAGADHIDHVTDDLAGWLTAQGTGN